MRIEQMLLVGVGGFFGAIARYAVSVWLTGLVGARLPLATLAVNVTGSFVLGVVLAWLHTHTDVSDNMRLLVATGFFGAYTTFSTYAVESVGLLRAEPANGLAYIVITNLICLLAALAGLAFGGRLS